MSIWDCDHAVTEIRRKIASNGTSMYGRMCVRCGVNTGKWLKSEFASQSLGDWDNSISKEWFHTRAELSRKMREEEGELQFKASRSAFTLKEQRDRWWIEYSEYLKSDAWRLKREQVFKRAGNICEGCAKNRATQVHHLTYARAGGNEMLFDLVAICDECHDKVHGK